MILHVYQLRSGGTRRPRSAILRGRPVRGRFIYREYEVGDRKIMRASIVDDKGMDLLDPLVHASIPKIGLGMHVVGTQYIGHGGAKSRTVQYPQSWVCAQTEPDLKALIGLVPEYEDEDDKPF
ncbi:hypothetical protein [Variovorax sp. HJSM1_2]|uniref:hypothetical protein n=1 Tax=Variovorax sp. HJSM1_2 TaxID=3366263 RepID=UPI003BBC757A